MCCINILGQKTDNDNGEKDDDDDDDEMWTSSKKFIIVYHTCGVYFSCDNNFALTTGDAL